MYFAEPEPCGGKLSKQSSQPYSRVMGNVLPANLHMQIRSGSCINKSIQPNEFLGWNSNLRSGACYKQNSLCLSLDEVFKSCPGTLWSFCGQGGYHHQTHLAFW